MLKDTDKIGHLTVAEVRRLAQKHDRLDREALARGDPHALEGQRIGESVAEALRRGVKEKVPTP